MILKLATKEVLVESRHMGWGTDTRLYRTVDDLRLALPARLVEGRPLVLKQHRGMGGDGVWKIELDDRSSSIDGRTHVWVQHAAAASPPERVLLTEFLRRCEPYFDGAGTMVEQPFQPRLPDGMIRCYMSADKVAGFGHQFIKALIPPPPDGPDSPAAQPGPRIMHGPDAPAFQALRTKMETEWTPQMMQTLGIDAASLPIIWDADFLYGPRTASGEDSYCARSTSVPSSRSQIKHRQLSRI